MGNRADELKFLEYVQIKFMLVEITICEANNYSFIQNSHSLSKWAVLIDNTVESLVDMHFKSILAVLT